VPTPISQVPSLGKYLSALRSLGYTSTEHVLGAGRAAGGRLAKFLGLSPADLTKLLAGLPAPARGGAAPRPIRRFRLGARIENVPRLWAVPYRSVRVGRPLPEHVDLIPRMQPVRDQGNRGTCVAFASAAALELYWAKGGPATLDLSEQFLYCKCKERDGEPKESGTYVRVAMECVGKDGCCLEVTWPYVDHDVPRNEGQGPAPDAAAREAKTYRTKDVHALAPTDVAGIQGELAEGRCVAFSVPVFDSWYRNPEVQRTGEILNPIPGEAPRGGHAMCLVGYDDDPGLVALGGGRFRVRNSWGTVDWAYESAVGAPGYGSIPYSYVARFCVEAYSLGPG
jgi:C1A family cysteine protease